MKKGNILHMKKQNSTARRRRAFSLMTMAMLLAALLLGVVSVQASETDELKETPTYTVRVYAGNMGTIDGGDLKTIPDVADNTTAPGFDVKKAVDVKDGRYYAKGIRLSGADNSTYFNPANGITSVRHDTDYVVAYGMEGTSVEYTVNYVDTNGTPRAGSDTFYGNVGDVPVVAYKHIEGYYPNTRNITDSRGLSEDPTQNIFTFVYQPVPTPAPTVTTTTTTTTVVEPAAGTGTGTAGTGTGTGTGTAGQTGTGTAGTGTGTTETGAAGTAGTTGAGQTGTGAAGAGAEAGTAATAGTTGAGQTGTGAAGAGAEAGTAATAGTTGAGQTGTGSAGAGAEVGTPATAGTTGQQALPATPEEIPEIVDIAEQEVPLAAGDNANKTENDSSAESSVSTSSVSADEETEAGSAAAMEKQKEGLLGNMSKGLLGGLIGGAAAAVVAIAGFGRYLIKTRKDEIESGLDDKEDGYSFEDDDDNK